MALGVDARQRQGNLFGRPALSQQMLHDVKQDGVGMQFTHRAALYAAVLAALLRRGGRLALVGRRRVGAGSRPEEGEGGEKG